mmetsp:Transcript_63158/g.105041  ORF Transcript_63158/g.105041 Transcript_63158/m.105041 type:complete len:320 (+) Transcript_63158:32-991(+)
MQAEAFRKIHPLQYHLKFLNQGVRPDGRGLLRARRVVANTRVITAADGSAMVKLGQTMVLVGIQAQPICPLESDPGRGRIVVSLELAATSSHAAGTAGRSGGQGARLEREQAAVLEALQRQASSGCVDLDTLCIEKGRAVWNCLCDIYVLEADGNLLDACLLAMSCALQDVRLPAVEVREDEVKGTLIYVQQEAAVPLVQGVTQYAISFGLLDSHLILDPTGEEELLLSTSFTLLLDEDGNFCALHKAGGGPISQALIDQSLAAARKWLPKLTALLRQCAAVHKEAHIGAMPMLSGTASSPCASRDQGGSAKKKLKAKV